MNNKPKRVAPGRLERWQLAVAGMMQAAAARGRERRAKRKASLSPTTMHAVGIPV